jgi:molecular chaperone GrpE
VSGPSDGTTSFGGRSGPPPGGGSDREPFDLDTGEEIDLEAEARRIVADLDAASVGVDGLEQSAEDAVAEAVEIAQQVEAERDELRDLLQRVQAEFANYKRRVDTQRDEQRASAAADLVRELLPVLDAGEAALAQGLGEVEPLHTQLLGTLEKLGLVRVAEADVPFDPNIHEAVMHAEGDGDPSVAQVLRSGYLWNAKVLRPAMVQVVG